MDREGKDYTGYVGKKVLKTLRLNGNGESTGENRKADKMREKGQGKSGSLGGMGGMGELVGEEH